MSTPAAPLPAHLRSRPLTQGTWQCPRPACPAQIPELNQHNRGTGAPLPPAAPTHCASPDSTPPHSGLSLSVPPSVQWVLGRTIPKSLPQQGCSPLHELHHQPPQQSPAQSQVTPKLLLEEIGIHDGRQKGKGDAGGMRGGCWQDDKCIQCPRRSNATICSRCTPGNLWPHHPALEIYLLPVSHQHLSSCALPPCVLSTTSPGNHGVCLFVSCGDI